MVRIEEKPQPISAMSIIEMVCKQRRVDMSDCFGSARHQELVQARNLCFHFLKYSLSMTLNQIGNIFNKHYSTVIYGLVTLSVDLEQNKMLRVDFERLKHQIEILINHEDYPKTN